MIFKQQYSLPLIEFPDNILINHPNKEEKNNCVTFYYYIGEFEPLKWVHMFLIYLILELPFFDKLRTKMQLGYLVRFSIGNLGNNYYLFEKVQSDRNGKELIQAINSFNDNITKIISKCNLNEWKKSAKNYLEEKDNNTSEIFDRLFSEIISRKYLFNRKKLLIKQLKLVTIDSLINFVENYIYLNKNKSIVEVRGN
jgi:insulysin